jgi:hypothetical protein
MSVNYKIEQKPTPEWVRQDMATQNIKNADIFTGSKVKIQQKKQEANSILAPRERWADIQKYGDDSIKQMVEKRAETQKVQVAFDEGMPINPMGKVGIKGQGVLGKWGPNFAVDLVPFVIDNKGIHQITITRKDNSGKAMIGGFLDPEDNSIKAAAIREGVEEALSSKITNNLAVKLEEEFLKKTKQTAMISNGDGRNTDNSWMMTSLVYGVLPHEIVKEIKVEGKDDASEARFEKISSNLYNDMKFASHGALILNNWKEMERMLEKEVKSRFELGYINKVGFNNAINQLNEIRSEIEKTLGAKEAIYGKEKLPNLPELKFVSERERGFLGSEAVSIGNLKSGGDNQPRINSDINEKHPPEGKSKQGGLQKNSPASQQGKSR